MNLKKTLFLLIIIYTAINFTSCDNKYDSFRKEYEKLYEEIILQIDYDNIPSTVQSDIIINKLNQIELIVNNVEEHITYDKEFEFKNYKMRYEEIREIISKMNKWTGLSKEDKYSVRIKVDIMKFAIKSKQNDDN